jgi:hypothetical protein
MRQAEDISSAEYPLVNLFYRANMMLVGKHVKGVYRTTLNNLYFRAAYVEE